MNQMDLTLHEKLNTDTFGMLDTNVRLSECIITCHTYHILCITLLGIKNLWKKNDGARERERERERERTNYWYMYGSKHGSSECIRTLTINQ